MIKSICVIYKLLNCNCLPRFSHFIFHGGFSRQDTIGVGGDGKSMDGAFFNSNKIQWDILFRFLGGFRFFFSSLKKK